MPCRKWVNSMQYLTTRDKLFYGTVLVVCSVCSMIIMYELIKMYGV